MYKKENDENKKEEALHRWKGREVFLLQCAFFPPHFLLIWGDGLRAEKKERVFSGSQDLCLIQEFFGKYKNFPGKT